MHRRADGREAELVLAPPLYLDGLTGPANGDGCGIAGSIVGAVVAVAARALRVFDVNILRRKPGDARQRAANGIDALRVGPDGQDSVLEPSDAVRRTHRGVRDERPAITRLVPAAIGSFGYRSAAFPRRGGKRFQRHRFG